MSKRFLLRPTGFNVRPVDFSPGWCSWHRWRGRPFCPRRSSLLVWTGRCRGRRGARCRSPTPSLRGGTGGQETGSSGCKQLASEDWKRWLYLLTCAPCCSDLLAFTEQKQLILWQLLFFFLRHLLAKTLQQQLKIEKKKKSHEKKTFTLFWKNKNLHESAVSFYSIIDQNRQKWSIDNR